MLPFNLSEECLGSWHGGNVQFAFQRLDAAMILMHCLIPMSLAQITTHQTPMGILTAVVLRQDLLAEDDAHGQLAVLKCVLAQLVKDVEVDVFQVFPFNQGPVIVNVFSQVIPLIQNFGFFKLLDRPGHIFLASIGTPFLIMVEKLLAVDPYLDIRVDEVAVVLVEDLGKVRIINISQALTQAVDRLIEISLGGIGFAFLPEEIHESLFVDWPGPVKDQILENRFAFVTGPISDQFIVPIDTKLPQTVYDQGRHRFSPRMMVFL